MGLAEGPGALEMAEEESVKMDKDQSDGTTEGDLGRPLKESGLGGPLKDSANQMWRSCKRMGTAAEDLTHVESRTPKDQDWTLEAVEQEFPKQFLGCGSLLVTYSIPTYPEVNIGQHPV